MHKINLVWDKQRALRSLCWSGEMVCVERMKELARRGMKENLAGHVHPGLRRKQKAMTERGKTKQSKAQRGVKGWSSAPDFPGDSIHIGLAVPWSEAEGLSGWRVKPTGNWAGVGGLVDKAA